MNRLLLEEPVVPPPDDFIPPLRTLCTAPLFGKRQSVEFVASFLKVALRGDTFQTNKYVDVVLRTGLPEPNALYADGHDLTDPYLSPLYADFSRGFPPTFIHSGTRDIFLSNAVRLQLHSLA